MNPCVHIGGVFPLSELETILGKPVGIFRGFQVVWLVFFPFKFMLSLLSLLMDFGHL
jgi:hypothetical protein